MAMPAKAHPLAPIPWHKVRLTGGLLAGRQEINRRTTLPIQYEQCRITGRLDTFKLRWKPGSTDLPKPHEFWDSDIAKWIEAAAYSLATDPDPQLAQRVDALIAEMAAAQRPDGYLNSYFITGCPEKRWTNLRDMHELYCAGHLMEAAVAYAEATGKTALLDVMCRYADHIDATFGPEPGKKRGYCGHEEVELALVRLYRQTGNSRYLRLASYFIDERGRRPHYFDEEARARGEDPARYWAGSYDYVQAHEPVREQKDMVGHSVRAAYLLSGMVDVAHETADRGLLAACRRLWDSITTRRMYITGGIGSSHIGERFTFDYDLPNEEAYAETCAAIALVFAAHRMLIAERDGRYADAMERCLYNGVLSGMSLDGTRFYYDNYLASVPGWHELAHRKSPLRQEWFGCACCPPNLARLLASIGQYIYSQSADEVSVDLYAGSNARFDLGGTSVELEQTTGYPWDGAVTLSVRPQRQARFSLALRIPSWCDKASLKVNGKPTSLKPITRRGYARVKRLWSAGDRVELVLPMPVQRVTSHPRVRQNAGRVALQRGPIVYCLEQKDNGADLNAIELPSGAKFTVRHEPRMLGGVTTITARACRLDPSGWTGQLYRPGAARSKPATIKAVPYYTWANRGLGEMLVWMRAGT
jgi:hypothetical protein